MQKMYQNRTLRQLVSEKEKVWVYLESAEICSEFFSQARAEGFSFGNLPYGEWVTGTLIAIHSDGQMGHAPYFAYSMLHSDRTDIVDYRKFTEGKEFFNYSFKERNDNSDG